MARPPRLRRPVQRVDRLLVDHRVHLEPDPGVLAAQRSRQRLFDALAGDNAPLPPWLAPLGREKCLARLEAMSMWPARWPRVNQLALASIVAAVCLVFYKVGLIVVALGLVLVCYRLFSAKAALAR